MTVLLGAIVGYLLGSVSFARIVASRVLPDEDDWETSFDVGGEGYAMVGDAITPGTVAVRAGSRYGGLSTLGDMGKAAVAVGLMWLLFDRPAAAAAGAAAVVGHIWPLYHRFKGAYGISPIIGAALVLSPLSVPFALVAGALGAWVFVEVTVSSILWPVFLVVWGVAFSDEAFVWFAVVANIAYLIRMLPNLKGRVEYRRQHRPDARRRAREIIAGYRTNPFA